jgi:hypothetical protein
MTKKTTKKKIKNAPIPQEQQTPEPLVETPTQMPPEPEEAFLKKELPPELVNEMPSSKSVKVPNPAQIIEVSPVPDQVLSPPKTKSTTPAEENEVASILVQIKEEMIILRKILEEHSLLLSDIQQSLAKKRNPPKSSDRVKILDKTSGITYKSKNNCYKMLLTGGELKDLVEKGVFGPDPMKNTFGWYALERAFPGRFEEVVEGNPIDSLS